MKRAKPSTVLNRCGDVRDVHIGIVRSPCHLFVGHRPGFAFLVDGNIGENTLGYLIELAKFSVVLCPRLNLMDIDVVPTRITSA